MKFHFNLQTQTLKLVQADHFLVLDHGCQFSYFGGIGFTLDSEEPPQSWIIFYILQEKVRILYKTQKDGSAIYYGRIISRPPGGIIEVEFSEWDKVKK
jgi:hypothetical protein